MTSIAVQPGTSYDSNQVLELAAAVESVTRHPLADGIAAEAEARGLCWEVSGGRKKWNGLV